MKIHQTPWEQKASKQGERKFTIDKGKKERNPEADKKP
jgi:hypothetical protein